LHGSVVVGSALVSGFALLELVTSLRTPPRGLRRRPIALLVAPWLCVLASPYATSLPGYYRDVLSGGFGSYVTEWAPTTLTPQNSPIYLLAIGGFWLLGRAGVHASWFEKLAFLGLTLLAFDAVRNAVWLALVALVVLPRLVDSLRSTPVEPARLNRLLAIAMTAGVVVATAGVAAKKTSWFTQSYPARVAEVAAAAAGPKGRVFANERFADWLIWGHPELAGRVAFDSRFELLTAGQLRAVADFRNRIDGWTSLLRGYHVLVLDRVADRRPGAALLQRHEVHRVATTDDLVVLARSG
jgi:hypothetical protein